MILLWSYITGITFDDDKIEQIERITKTKTRRYLYEKDMVRHLTGLLLAEYGWNICSKNSTTNIIENRYKPYYQGLYESHNWHFNISHSEDIVACAIDSSNIGIDIEKVRKFPIEIASIFFDEEEQEYCLQEDRLLFKIWTRKESYLKATGEGVRGLKRTVGTVKAGELINHFCGYEFVEVYLDPEYETVICTKRADQYIEIIEVNGECLEKYLKTK